MDLIGKIKPISRKKNCFIIVATDYFTKWVEAKPYKEVSEFDVIQFIKEMIVHRLGIPQSITVDNGTIFNGTRVKAFTQEYGIRILNSTPYYAQENGQVEATNKIIKNNLRKIVARYSTSWDDLLSEVLWAYRTSKRMSINTTPYSLVFGHDAVLPMEITVRSMRITRQNELTHLDYQDAMFPELDEIDEACMAALDSIVVQKQKIYEMYNKRIKAKSFAIGDLVWKVILPIGVKDPYLGKWSPNWDGPFLVSEVFDGNAYKLMDISGNEHARSINSNGDSQTVVAKPKSNHSMSNASSDVGVWTGVPGSKLFPNNVSALEHGSDLGVHDLKDLAAAFQHHDIVHASIEMNNFSIMDNLHRHPSEF
ncbi:uncharacterized protein LOC115980916 [Quercus lobata]|uniref:uncharacterized protein LOC115980916 n=1 Tax=Quercus lobata TaxID=97700 RepID=UPI0012475F00|nr:uncharacterized protein LOC115980916 [Quercus lobata]